MVVGKKVEIYFRFIFVPTSNIFISWTTIYGSSDIFWSENTAFFFGLNPMSFRLFLLKPLLLFRFVSFFDSSELFHDSDSSLDLLCIFIESTFILQNTMYILNLTFFVSKLKMIFFISIYTISRKSIF